MLKGLDTETAFGVFHKLQNTINKRLENFTAISG